MKTMLAKLDWVTRMASKLHVWETMPHIVNRRAALMTLASCVLGTGVARAEEGYPTKAVSLVSGYAAGGPVDIFGRIAAAHFSDALKVPFLVETKTGASGTIAGEYVARSAPDGYRLLVTVPSLFTMLPFIMDNMRVQERDFVPIGQIAEAPMVLLCNPQLPARNIKEFLRLLEKDRNLRFASAGPGTLPHLATELLLSRVGASAIHVPYKGSAPALQDLVGGQVHFDTDNLAPAMPLIKAGRVRALAVTSSKRFSGLPNIPTLAESGVDDFNVANWFGVFAPAATPEAIVRRLSGEMRKMAASPAFQEKVLAQSGVVIARQGPEQTRKRITDETAQWAPLIRKLGLKA